MPEMPEDAVEGIRGARTYGSTAYIFRIYLVGRQESKYDRRVYTKTRSVTKLGLQAFSEAQDLPSACCLCRQGTS
jgi:hypothetical protein